MLYRPGKDNAAVDAPSRVLGRLLALTGSVSTPLCHLMDQLKPELGTNSTILLTIVEGVNDKPVDYTDFQLWNGLLRFKGRLVVPKNSSLKQLIIFESHNSPLGGHAGIARTFA